MASGQWAVVLRHVQQLFRGESVSGLSEGQLLDRFVTDRDEVAFGAIVARHGSMVLGVCRGVLDDPRDVEDAFQATFLVLVRKAGGLRDRDLLGQWLYGVARRVALRARAEVGRRRARERPEIEAESASSATLDSELRELQVLIHEEVDRLSSEDRMAIVLCYLEGLTHAEAADRLGWPVGTVKGRLSRAREKLRSRLTRRGVALPVALASTLARGASAAVPAALLRSTTLAAARLASGKNLEAGIVSAHALTLMEGVIGTMFTTKLKLATMALMATCALAVPGVMAYQGTAGATAKKTQVPSPEAALPKVVAAGNVKITTEAAPDLQGGQEEQARLSEQALKTIDRLVAIGEATPSSPPTYLWSRRLAEAKSAPGVPEPERKAALQAHRDRMKKIVDHEDSLAKKGELSALDVMEAQYRLMEAERWLRDGRVGIIAAGPPGIGVGGFGGGGFGGRGALGGGAPGMGGPAGGFANPGILSLNQTPADEKRNEAIRALLDRTVSMNFPNPTPFEDVKKYVESATQDEASGLPTGLPIYVDPDGLKEADSTMASTITIHLEGVPLRTTLRLVVRQLGLEYRIDGGVLIISDIDSIAVQELKALRNGKPNQRTDNPGGFR